MNEDTQKPISIEELLSPKPVKKKSKIHEFFFDKLTPEERAAHYERTRQKSKETRARKAAERAEMIRKAQDLVPELIAHDIAAGATSNENWTPKQETIDKIKELTAKGLTVEEMRRKYFRGIKDSTWQKLMQFVFKSQVSKADGDLGVDILAKRDEQRKIIKRQLTDIEQQIRAHRKETKKKTIPAWLMHMKIEREDRLMQVEQEVAKILHSIGAVGDKSKAPSLNINITAPRPKKNEDPASAAKEVIETAAMVVEAVSGTEP